MSILNRLFEIPSSDPDDVRRRKLLNVLLIGVSVLTIIGLLAAEILYTTGQAISAEEKTLILISGPLLLLSLLIIFTINRFVAGNLASIVFLLLLLGIFLFTDTPSELANGRSLFVFFIPITIASLLIRPGASFIFAALGSIEIALLADYLGILPNVPAITGFFLLAIISWLSSRSLEQALRDLRTVNAELDQRVEDRTRELTESLAREVAETSKTQAILESITDGVIVFDTSGKAMVANLAIDRLLGIKPNDLIEKTIEEIAFQIVLNDQDRQALSQLLDSPYEGSSPVRFKRGGKTLSVIAAPVQSEAGGVFGTVAVFRDYTREAEVEQMKNTFIAMVSHELRTPLSAVLAYAEMLRDKVYGPVNAKQANVAQRIYANSQRLLILVSDLLDQAQIEAGTLKIHLTEFNPGELIDAMQGTMEKPAKDKGLELSSHIDPGVPGILYGDPQRLQQVLVNLVNNAVKFTEKGKVTVSLYLHDAEQWALEVMDTGPGISTEAQEYIFESFRQVNTGDTRNHGGIGLGLSIVKRLVNLMFGEISLTSTLNQGTTFTAKFPLHPPTREHVHDTTDRIDSGR